MAKKTQSAQATDKNGNRRLVSGEPCPDYPYVKQMFTACQNCRYNIFFSLERQLCRPHTPEDAQRKGAPNAVPDTYFAQHMKKVFEHEAEKRKQAEEEAQQTDGNI